MALSFVDIEMGLPEDVCEDTSCSKEVLRGSPFSQASTAPCTPIRFFLPDPFDVPPPPQPSFSNHVSQAPLSICMSPCWAEYKQAGKPDTTRAAPKSKKCEVQVSKSMLSIGMSPWWAQYRQGWRESIPLVLRIPEPSLKSELGIWAQNLVVAKKHVPRSQQEFAVLEFVCKHKHPVVMVTKVHEPRSQHEFAALDFVYKHRDKHPVVMVTKVHVPRMQQELAVLESACKHKHPLFTVTKVNVPRSQEEVAALDFVYKHSNKYPVVVVTKDHVPRNQQHFAVLESVTKHEDTVEDVDADWDIRGQIQDRDQDVDEDDDDDWLQVDELYTPSVLEGMCVLTANPDSAGMAGRALTPDGRVIELNGGGPVVFSCEAEHSSGHARKVAAMSARLAKAAADVDTETICSIDAAGTVRGGAAVHATAAQTKKYRLKLVHRKRKHCQVGATPSRATRHSQALSVDAAGHVFLPNVKKARRTVRVPVSNAPSSVMTVDVIGVVRDVIEPWDVRRGIDIDPEVVLIIDSHGVIRTEDDPFAGL